MRFRKLMLATLSAFFPLALVAPAPAAVAQSGGALNAVADETFQLLVREKQIPALIVAVSQGGQRSYFGYSGAEHPPLAADTIIEVGSITKVLTAILFAEAVVDGRMAPDDSIQRWMPQAIRLPWKTQQITPLQLASYRSGMPRLPANVPQGGIEARDIDHYTTADFLNWVAQWTPEGELPTPYLYSNASIALLALLVGQARGGQWWDLMRSRIIDPLGMIDTVLETRPDQAPRVAQGHAEDGAPVRPWPLFVWSAGSSLKSTARDMLVFGEANLGHRTATGATATPSLAQAMRLAMRPVYRPEGQDFDQAMVWAIFPADPEEGSGAIVAKSGNTDGFSTVLVLDPAKDLAICIGANKSKVDVQPLAIELARQIR